MRRALIAGLLVSALTAYGKVKATSYAKKFYGRRTASGERLTQNKFIVGVNRDSLYGHVLLLWSHNRGGVFNVPVMAADKFNRAKFRVSYIKIDATARVMFALGLRHTAWIDSVTVVR